MAGEADPRCRSTRRQWEKKPRTIIALSFLLLLVLVSFPLHFYQPMESAPTTIASRHGRKERGCMQAVPRPHHVQGTRSNLRRRLTSDLNQINVPAATSHGSHALRSPPSVASGRYNADAHEVVTGPNPMRNRSHHANVGT